MRWKFLQFEDAGGYPTAAKGAGCGKGENPQIAGKYTLTQRLRLPEKIPVNAVFFVFARLGMAVFAVGETNGETMDHVLVLEPFGFQTFVIRRLDEDIRIAKACVDSIAPIRKLK